MRLYHFNCAKYGLENLSRGRLKIAEIDDLNDPFELRAFGSPLPHVRAALEKTRANLASSKGMLCFSRDWRNPVQWSHYADKHKGLALGFDIPDRLLAPISYRAHRIPADIPVLLAGGGSALDLMTAGLTTKYSHWSYEKEVRVMAELNDKDPDTGLFFAPFSTELAIAEVIVGHCASISRGELADALGSLSSKVKVRKARLAFGTFKVVEQRKASLWI